MKQTEQRGEVPTEQEPSFAAGGQPVLNVPEDASGMLISLAADSTASRIIFEHPQEEPECVKHFETTLERI
jgi:hypothetical protein